MKIKDYVCNCGTNDFVFVKHGRGVTSIHCTECGKLLKWATRDDKIVAYMDLVESIQKRLNKESK